MHDLKRKIERLESDINKLKDLLGIKEVHKMYVLGTFFMSRKFEYYSNKFKWLEKYLSIELKKEDSTLPKYIKAKKKK